MGMGVVGQSHSELADIKRCSFLYCELDASVCFGSPALARLKSCGESRPAHIDHDEVVLKERLKCHVEVGQSDKAPKQRHC